MESGILNIGQGIYSELLDIMEGLTVNLGTEYPVYSEKNISFAEGGFAT